MKILKLMLAMALVFVTVFALASCGGCEHTYDEAITTKPTCTEKGVKTFTCSLCGESYTEAIPVVDHTYQAKEPVPPTCVKEGHTTYICACGDKYEADLVPATGHSYSSVVTPANCSTEGYTTYTCKLCGDSMKDDITAKNNVHVYKTVIVELTDAQAAANPHAIGAEKNICTLCSHEELSGEAVLVFLDFDNLINNVKDYEAVASDNYKAMLELAKDYLSIDVQKTLILFDEQKNLDVYEGWGKSKDASVKDGKLVPSRMPFYVYDLLNLASKKPAVSDFTITFDYTVIQDPKTYSAKDYCPFFMMTTEANNKQFYNNQPVVLALDKIDMDSGILDEVYSYELIVKGFQWGQLKQDAKTGYNITLGKEYSFKLDFTAKDGVYMYTLWVKAVGEAEYTNLGTYDYPAHNDAGSMFNFSNSSNVYGNMLDNFKITTTLAE